MQVAWRNPVVHPADRVSLDQPTTSISGRDVQAVFRRRHQARRPPPAKIRLGSPAPAMGPGTADTGPTSNWVIVKLKPLFSMGFPPFDAAADSMALTEFTRPGCIFWTTPAATFGVLLICVKNLFVGAKHGWPANFVAHKDVDPEEWGRELGVLKPYGSGGGRRLRATSPERRTARLSPAQVRHHAA